MTVLKQTHQHSHQRPHDRGPTGHALPPLTVAEAFYDQETFDRLYDGANLARVKERYDTAHRQTSLYDKAVRRR